MPRSEKQTSLLRFRELRVVIGDLITDYRPLIPDMSVFCRPGGSSGEPEPDPIPNSAVKLPSADGTKSQDLEE